MITKYRSLAALVLAVNLGYLPSSYAVINDENEARHTDNANTNQDANVVKVKVDNTKQVKILCPKKLRHDDLMELDKQGKVNINDVNFTRVMGPIWDRIDYGPFKEFMKSDSPLKAHYRELDFTKANIDVKQKPEVITCIYNYSLPNNNVKGSNNTNVVTTRGIGLIYKNPQ